MTPIIPFFARLCEGLTRCISETRVDRPNDGRLFTEDCQRIIVILETSLTSSKQNLEKLRTILSLGYANCPR